MKLKHLFGIIFLLLGNVEVAELVSKLVGALGDDADEITQVVFLQVLLGEVLNVLLGEGELGRDNNLGGVVFVGGNLNLGAEVTGLAFDLDALGQELGETRAVDDVVLGGLGQVHVELDDLLLTKKRKINDQIVVKINEILRLKRKFEICIEKRRTCFLADLTFFCFKPLMAMMKFWECVDIRYGNSFPLIIHQFRIDYTFDNRIGTFLR